MFDRTLNAPLIYGTEKVTAGNKKLNLKIARFETSRTLEISLHNKNLFFSHKTTFEFYNIWHL